MTRKAFAQIIKNALFTSVSAALIGAAAYWAGTQWLDAVTTSYAQMLVTDTMYIVFTH